MIIELDDGSRLNGSDIVDCTLRTTLEPIPCSLELIVRLHEEYASGLLDGKILKVGKYQTPVKIIFVQDSQSAINQGGLVTYRHVIALHENSVGISYRLGKSVIREKVSLSEIYKACGGNSKIGRDYTVNRFYCYKGMYPSVEIAQACQDGGGVIRLNPKTNAVEFWRVYDLFGQESVALNDASIDSTFVSGFLEKHELPIYVSTNADGSFSKSQFSGGESRSIEYIPRRSAQELNARSSVLMNAKMVPTVFSPDLNAGDLIQIAGVKFVIITAAHRITSDGGTIGDSTNLWLGVKS